MSSLARRLGFENLELRRLLAAVNIPDDLTGQVGAEVSTPVNIDTAAGVRGAEIRIAYDPDVFTLNEDDIVAGTSWEVSDLTQVVASVNAAAGTVVIFISSSTELSSGPGSLAILGFRIRDAVAADTQSVIDLVEVRLNEGTITVNPAPVAGADSTDGLIAVLDGQPGQADRIAGTVYADTNTDNSPGPLEGIPGVLITLVNVSTNATRETTTGDNGQFEFLNVAAGNYRIIQTHPQAYIDGGTNELTATLAVGQNLVNQNFREVGLRAAYVFNRLATTSALPVGSTAWVNTLRAINITAATDASNTTQVSSGESAGDAEAASTQAFLLGDQANPVTPLSEPVSASAGFLEPIVNSATGIIQPESEQVTAISTGPESQKFLYGQPQVETEDEEDNHSFVDDALAQTGLW